MTRALLLCVFLMGTTLANADLFTVINANDSGAGSLRQAINEANAVAGPHTILIGDGLTIQPGTALPAITTNETSIAPAGDATLDGTNLSGDEAGLSINADDCDVFGLTVINFPGAGVEIVGDNNVVRGCLIGNDGTNELPNGGDGVYVEGNSNLVGGTGANDRNIIGGNNENGIRVFSESIATGTTNQITNNYIGIASDGETFLGNDFAGIFVHDAPSTIIGGSDPDERNVISFNVTDGIRILVGNFIDGPLILIENNLIGLTADGAAAAGNGRHGINSLTNEGLLVGGLTAASRNIISGNQLSGIRMNLSVEVEPAQVIRGNYIGTDINGTNAIPNGTRGIQIEQPGVTVAENVISGNTSHGVYVFASDRTIENDYIFGNIIGLAANQTDPLPNGGAGIAFERSSLGGSILDIVVGESAGGSKSPNIIAKNTGAGIDIVSEAGIGFITVTENSIYDNGGAGIEIAPGSNQNVQPPTLALSTAPSLRAVGSAPLGSIVELYADAADEGQIFIESITVTNKGGNPVYESTADLTPYIGMNLTATQTESASTSEFAGPVAIVSGEGEGGGDGIHSADLDADNSIDLSELLRLIQLYNSGAYHCDAAGEDGYAAGSGDQNCAPHDADFDTQDWNIDLGELLRPIQFFNSDGYVACQTSQDGFCPLN